MTKKTAHMLAICERNSANSKTDAEGREAPAQMSLWEDQFRAIPNAFARCPIFGLIPANTKMEDRILYNKTLLPSPKGFEMRYTGYQIGQPEGEIFMQIVNDAAGTTIRADNEIYIDRAKLLRATDRNTSGENYKWVGDVIHRLNNAHFDLRMQREAYSGNLILEVFERDKDMFITLSPTLARLFAANQRTLIDWDKRMMIKRQVDLAKWLQTYIGSHEVGLQRSTITNLAAWSGYKSPVRKFRKALFVAVEELERVGIIANAQPYKEDSMMKWTRL